VRCLFEDFALDADRRELRRGGDLVLVEPQVLDLLAYLIANRERVISRDDLLASVWRGRIVSESALNSRISAARSAIGDTGQDQRLIKTLPRKGFRFIGMIRKDLPVAAVSVSHAPMEEPAPEHNFPDKPSIAVLPFTNLSTEAELQYFADGIVEDIITDLSRFSELFVIARNSSLQYVGKSPDVRQVGQELGVRYVLEGSVRRGGD